MNVEQGSIKSGGSAATEATLLKLVTLGITQFDYVAVTYPGSASEVYVFKTGGSGGTTLATVTLAYVDGSKANLLTLTKT